MTALRACAQPSAVRFRRGIPPRRRLGSWDSLGSLWADQPLCKQRMIAVLGVHSWSVSSVLVGVDSTCPRTSFSLRGTDFFRIGGGTHRGQQNHNSPAADVAYPPSSGTVDSAAPYVESAAPYVGRAAIYMFLGSSTRVRPLERMYYIDRVGSRLENLHTGRRARST